MKKLISLFLFCLSLNAPAQTSNIITNAITTTATATWTDDVNDPATIRGYMVYIAHKTGTPTVSKEVAVMECDLIPLLLQVPNGEYRVWVTAVNLGGVESEPSEVLAFFWYGHPPAPPGPVVIIFNRLTP